MKVAPVSADLLIKLTLGAAAVGLVLYGLKRAANAASAPFGAITDVLYNTADAVGQAWNNGTINPASTNNAVYAGLNGSIWPDGSETLGTWLYGAINPDPLAPSSYGNALSAWQTAGRMNNPSAYVAPSNQGGAAFGIYPRP
jgi:hypothetical protein